MSRHAPPPTHPTRAWLSLMAAAIAGIIVPPTVLAAHAVAPRVAADEHLALTPERSPEPVAHGGPLSIPSIGASGAWERPEDSVRDETPHHAAPSARHRSVAVRPPTVTTAAGMGTPATTTTPEVTTSTPTPSVAAAATTATTAGSTAATTPPVTTQSSSFSAATETTTPSPSVPGTPDLPELTTASSGSTALDEEPVIAP